MRLNRLLRYFSVNKQEMKTFSGIKGWWDPTGPMHILYQYNYIRVNFLLENIQKINGSSKIQTKPLSGLRIADVGCGAGLLSESLARLGGNVLAIDPNQNSIAQARKHKEGSSALETLQYKQTTVEQLLQLESQKFDVVTSMEVIQHVQNPSKFVSDLSKLLKNKGILMMSTIQRNWISYFTHIVFAEHLTRIVPVGTHHHQKFINPNQLQQFMIQNECYKAAQKNLMVSPFGNFKQCDQGDNYIIIAQKRVQTI